MKYAYRVDDERLDCVAVEWDKLADNTPINHWLPVMFGEGQYCYFEDEQEAKAALRIIIHARIALLQEKLEEIA